eukprot:TRINITY_DN6036_c0_g1_i1.p1 TRINITY_DN6036_c0_g1~~TRINITY_DN6036_c0_g1_i1.p1  ORF type:complete len:402 (+),score=68.80 TRINITY_DN6036_c0_g1_i1:58-1206(+)
MSHAHEVPTVVGNYVLQQTLGRGGYGSVRLANNMFRNELIACKQIKAVSLTEKQKEHIQREIDFMKKLTHRNIIAFRKVIHEFDYINIFMEYASGGTLHAHIQKSGHLSESVSREFFRQIHDAVQYMHGSLIIHRDLKTDNILLTNDLVPKLVDFGLSTYYVPGEKTNKLGWCGTLGYRSPEMVEKSNYVGPEVDIWSLGVILFEMFTGKLPFSNKEMNIEEGVGLGMDEEEVNQRILKREFVVAVQMPSPLKYLIDGMLNLDPEKRFTNQQISDSPWLNEPLETLEESPLEESGKHYKLSRGKDKSRSFSLTFWSEPVATSPTSKSPPRKVLASSIGTNSHSNASPTLRSPSPLKKFSTLYRSTLRGKRIHLESENQESPL